VTYHPDTAKGNKNTFPFPPLGAIKEGKYTLGTGKQEGAPAGWYKVTVNASLPSKEEYGVPTPVVGAPFDKVETTPLSVEVKADAAPGSYDLKVTGQ